MGGWGVVGVVERGCGGGCRWVDGGLWVSGWGLWIGDCGGGGGKDIRVIVGVG